MSHRLPTGSRHIVDRMKLLMAANVQREAKWLNPLMATEAEYGPTSEGGARPAFTTLLELSDSYRSRIAALAPVLPSSRSRTDSGSAAVLRERPHKQICFPEDSARSAFLRLQTVPEYNDDGSVRYDGRRVSSRPRANLLESRPFLDSEEFVRRCQDASKTSDVRDGLATATRELKAKLEKDTQDHLAATATKTMVDPTNIAPIVAESMQSLFALMDQNRVAGFAAARQQKEARITEQNDNAATTAPADDKPE